MSQESDLEEITAARFQSRQISRCAHINFTSHVVGTFCYENADITCVCVCVFAVMLFCYLVEQLDVCVTQVCSKFLEIL